MKVERGSVPIKLTISQCFTPCFHAEIVTGSKEGADAAPVEDAEAASGGPQVLLSRDDVQRGEVIQLKISLNPPEELLEVEQNFKGKERKKFTRQYTLLRANKPPTHTLLPHPYL